MSFERIYITRRFKILSKYQSIKKLVGFLFLLNSGIGLLSA